MIIIITFVLNSMRDKWINLIVIQKKIQTIASKRKLQRHGGIVMGDFKYSDMLEGKFWPRMILLENS